MGLAIAIFGVIILVGVHELRWNGGDLESTG
jgi:hypothetical protein